MTLAELQVGQKAVISALQGNDSVTQRLMEMGLLKGETVELLGIAPLGDPLEVRLGSYRLSLRKAEAGRVLVTILRD
jgi:ferrous iron transport protein A